LHMRNNPTHNAQLALIDGLQARVRALRMQLDVAEAAGASGDGGGGGGSGAGAEVMAAASSAAALIEAQSEAEKLRKEMADINKQRDRLKTVFQQKIKEFRDKVLLLTGYRVDLPNAPPFNLYNLYPPYLPPTAESVLSFRCNDDGEMELLGTKFTDHLEAQIAAHLQERHSIPAFLSSVTLAILNKEVML